ncbi:unnamed protein product [Rotaria magnacalcarata]|uniref:Uncharacterized protein n=1 Tax=Rotaria magnacalcarata TaxID=392030 RepID=A0A816ETG8_9BILA|nr:unnamed protein product [Rotaria magnacalcarata]CAF4050520.1 unnamed protein product [Rotaria magnacalcarata]
MSEKCLAISDYYQANCIIALADLFYQQGNKMKPIKYCRKKLFWYRKRLLSNCLSLTYILMKIGELYDDNHHKNGHYLETALHFFEKNFHLEYATTADCFMLIAQHYQNQNLKLETLKYYKRVIDKRKNFIP